MIDILGEAIAVLRAGASALKAENADLRATHQRVHDRSSARTPADAAAADTELIEVCLRPDARASAAARAIVARRLRDRVPAPAFDRAQLLTSELVANRVLHSDPSAEAVLVFRLGLSQRAVRLEVEDPGHRGAVAPRSPDLGGGGGFGLNLVQELSERWGLERVAAGSTRVWAQVELRPLHAFLDRLASTEARSMPAADSGFSHTRSGADDWFSSYPDATPLAGRVVAAGELDDAAADALANPVAVFSDGRGRVAGAPARDATTPAPRAALAGLQGRIASQLGAGGAPNTAPAPIRTAGGWRNG